MGVKMEKLEILLLESVSNNHLSSVQCDKTLTILLCFSHTNIFKIIKYQVSGMGVYLPPPYGQDILWMCGFHKKLNYAQIQNFRIFLEGFLIKRQKAHKLT